MELLLWCYVELESVLEALQVVNQIINIYMYVVERLSSDYTSSRKKKFAFTPFIGTRTNIII